MDTSVGEAQAGGQKSQSFEKERVKEGDSEKEPEQGVGKWREGKGGEEPQEAGKLSCLIGRETLTENRKETEKSVSCQAEQDQCS